MIMKKKKDRTMSTTKVTSKELSKSDNMDKPFTNIKTHDELLAALYWCYDVFERANMLFFCVYDTAKAIKANENLHGDHIDIGVRKLEWVSGGKPILDAYMDQQRIKTVDNDDNTVKYEYGGVPVIVHIYEDDECLNNPDTVMYFMEDFKLPNPYERFERIYG